MHPTVFHLIVLILAPLLGAFATLLISTRNKAGLKLLLSFSGAYLFGVTVIHLIPETFSQANHLVGAFVMLGFFIQLVLEQFTSGVEHGHIHTPRHSSKVISGSVFVGLSVHAVMEGIPLGLPFQDPSSLTSLLFAIAIHKIPAAFALMAVLSYFKIGKTKAWLFIFLFALMSPAGMLTALFAEQIGILFLIENQAFVQAIVIGLFFHVSTTILFETSSKSHRFTFQRIAAILAGAALSLVSLWGH